MARTNKFQIDGKKIYICNTATGKPCPFDFPRTDITGAPERSLPITTGRSKAYIDAYALIFYANGGKPITCGGDKLVADRLIQEGFLKFDKGKNTLSPGRRLETEDYLLRDQLTNVFRLNPEHFDDDHEKRRINGKAQKHRKKNGEFYQAIYEGVTPEEAVDYTRNYELTDNTDELYERASKIMALPVASVPIGCPNPEQVKATIFRRKRDPAIVAWILISANGVCESCDLVAPFIKDDGYPYLEVHHVRPLAEDGSDSITNAVALCPNCHRRLHHSKDRQDTMENLYAKLARLKRE